MKNILSLRNVATLALVAVASTNLMACGTDIRDQQQPVADGGAPQGDATPPPVDNGQPIACGERLVNCSGTCRDLTSDGANCGGCGLACGAGQVCRSSACVPTRPTCGAGEMDCNGMCRNLQTSAENCGTCGHACSQNEVCRAGACTPSVPTCTANTQTDVANCGRCGNRCGSGESCMSGMCVGSLEDTYEYTVQAARTDLESMELDEFWNGAHIEGNRRDPGRGGMISTLTLTFRVARGAYIALNDEFNHIEGGRNVTTYGCGIVGGRHIVTGSRTLRRNGSPVAMITTGDNMGRLGCNFEVSDRPAPWR